MTWNLKQKNISQVASLRVKRRRANSFWCFTGCLQGVAFLWQFHPRHGVKSVKFPGASILGVKAVNVVDGFVGTNFTLHGAPLRHAPQSVCICCCNMRNIAFVAACCNSRNLCLKKAMLLIWLIPYFLYWLYLDLTFLTQTDLIPVLNHRLIKKNTIKSAVSQHFISQLMVKETLNDSGVMAAGFFRCQSLSVERTRQNTNYYSYIKFGLECIMTWLELVTLPGTRFMTCLS